jgi:ketosteroid isomerase-like protein
MVQHLYDAFNAGDIDALLARLTDDIDWVVPRIRKVPFSGPRRGRASVAEFFASVSEHQEPLRFDVHAIVAQGDRAIALGHYRWRVKRTGRTLEGDFAHAWTIKDEKVTRLQEYTDTAAYEAAY